jgi:hypothetical protein
MVGLVMLLMSRVAVQGKSRGRIAAFLLRVRMSRVQVSVPEFDCYRLDGGFS